jgi:hypothetical protein
LAAAQLDALWDASMVRLSESYVRTTDLLAEGKTEEAYVEFRRNFVHPMKKLYSEADEVYPPRFQKTDDWCKWTKQLYILTRRMEDALEAGKRDAAEYAPRLRAHFHALHDEAQVLKSNDLIYAFREALNGPAVSADTLAELKAALEKAEPSMKAQAEAAAYEQARQAWLEQVSPVLGSGSVEARHAAELRAVTESFYRAFGVQFE